MLNLFPCTARTCNGISRRNLLQVGALGGLGVTLPGVLANEAQAKPSRGSANKMNCIVVWTHGGTSHHDTYDPKPDAPLNIKGEFNVIDTAIPGVKFTEVTPRMAQYADRFALLRSWNPLNGSHGTADAYVMSGRKFNPAMFYPTVGSVVAWHHGFRNELPPFVQLGNNVTTDFGGGKANFLGIEHDPFVIQGNPAADGFTVRDITPPRGLQQERVARRRSVLHAVDGLMRPSSLQPKLFGVLDSHVETALDMITAPQTQQAFQIDKEDPKLRDSYGRNQFGQSLIMARRLIESGVRFVTVTDPAWDTHVNNFSSLKNSLMPRVDQGIPQLLLDLEQRGMLDNTLVVWLTDFGRTPKINSASGRDHWATAGFVIMAGAGLPGGAVLGATDGEGGVPIKNEYFSEDVMATIYHKLGLPDDLHAQAPDGRPLKLLDGRLIKEWV
jgi:uncharacterized protein (DUF1501 family)